MALSAVTANAAPRVTLFLAVRELALALVFYRDILGLEVLAQEAASAALGSRETGPVVGLYATGDTALDRDGTAPVARFAFDAIALAAIRARLATAAIPFQENDNSEIRAHDLDGHLLVLASGS